MRIKISILEAKILEFLKHRGLNEKHANIIKDAILYAELREVKTHGVIKLLTLGDLINQKRETPETVKDNFNYSLIDGHRELGYISAHLAINLLTDKVEKYGNGIIGIYNSSLYGCAGIYSEALADRGIISIIMSTGNTRAVTPYNSKTPILGTNPLSIGVPTIKGPMILDMATAIRPWSEIKLAKIESKSINENAYLDKEGNLTNNPNNANAVLPFGGAKGYALNIMIEILAGAFLGNNIGLAVNDICNNGFLFIGFNQNLFTNNIIFQEYLESLTNDINNAEPLIKGTKIYLPGEIEQIRYEKNTKNGYLEISDNIIRKINEIEDLF